MRRKYLRFLWNNLSNFPLGITYCCAKGVINVYQRFIYSVIACKRKYKTWC